MTTPIGLKPSHPSSRSFTILILSVSIGINFANYLYISSAAAAVPFGFIYMFTIYVYVVFGKKAKHAKCNRHDRNQATMIIEIGLHVDLHVHQRRPW